MDEARVSLGAERGVNDNRSHIPLLLKADSINKLRTADKAILKSRRARYKYTKMCNSNTSTCICYWTHCYK